MEIAVSERNFEEVYIDWKEVERHKPSDEHTLEGKTFFEMKRFSHFPSHADALKAEEWASCNKRILKFSHSRRDKNAIEKF